MPVGKVRDHYITGELQWEGTLRNLDRTDDTKNIPEGLVTWYHKNGAVFIIYDWFYFADFAPLREIISRRGAKFAK